MHTLAVPRNTPSSSSAYSQQKYEPREHRSFAAAVILLIPGLRDVFNVSTLHKHDVDFILIVGALPLLFGELTKLIKAAVRSGSNQRFSPCRCMHRRAVIGCPLVTEPRSERGKGSG